MGKRSQPTVRESTTNKGKIRFVVELGRRDGKRRSRTFPTRVEAELFRKTVLMEDVQLGNTLAPLPPRERQEFAAVLREMETHGVGFREVWDTYREHFLVDCPDANDAIRQYLVHQRARNLRPKYLQELEKVMPAFIEGREQDKVSCFRKADLETYLERYPNPHTFKGRLGILGSFFTFCVRQEWIKDNPASKVIKPVIEREAPKILPARDVKELLIASMRDDPELTPFFLLGIYCGIRPQEILRLEQQDYRWQSRTDKAGIVTLRSEVSKTRRRRIVDLPKVFSDWRDVTPASGWYGIENMTNRRKRIAKVKQTAGVKWCHDIMRHTAASVMVAKYESAEKAALQLGHSTTTLMTHYRELVPAEDCDFFYKICPETVLQK